jgi:Na+-transporting NADH:ubiquinone oxidoreductase subunit F
LFPTGNVATFIKEFVVRLPEGDDLNFDPGGYVQIDVPEFETSFRDFLIEEQFRDDWEKYKMWDLAVRNTEESFRAYSMANYPAEKNLIKLNIRIATPPWDKLSNDFMPVPPGFVQVISFPGSPEIR